jgi:hypothetical protein
MLPRSLIALLAPIVATASANDLTAQASFTTFGSSCVQGMAIGASSLPRLGQSLRITYTGPRGNHFIGFYTNIAQPILLLGLSNTQAGGVTLPFTLPTAVTNGAVCDLLVSPDAQLLMPLLSTPPPYGLDLAIPADQSLVGLVFHAQWLTISERSLFGQILWVMFATSDAGTAVVGV